MPSRTLSMLKPSRSLRKLQTVFDRSGSDSSDSSSSPHSTPTSATAASAIDFRGLDKSLNASVTNLILTSLDENGSWASSENPPLALSSSYSSTSTRSNSYTPAPQVVSTEPRGLMRMMRGSRKKSDTPRIEEQSEAANPLLGERPTTSSKATSERIEDVNANA